MQPPMDRGTIGGCFLPVDARCDLFSLGCMLYRMATGALPFKGTDPMSILLAVTSDEPEPPRKLNPALPAALSDLIMQLLAKDPKDRPASSRAVVESLEAIERKPGNAAIPVAKLVGQSGTPVAPKGQVSGPRRRYGLVAAVGAGVLFLTLAVLGIMLFRGTQKGSPAIQPETGLAGNTKPADSVKQITRTEDKPKGTEDIKALVATMEKDENSVARMKAAQQLGELKADGAVTALFASVKNDASSHVRAAAIKSLGQIVAQKENAGLVPTVVQFFGNVHRDLDKTRMDEWQQNRWGYWERKPADKSKPADPSDKPKAAEPFVYDPIYDAMLEALERIGSPGAKPAFDWLPQLVDTNILRSHCPYQHSSDVHIRAIKLMGMLAMEIDRHRASVVTCLSSICNGPEMVSPRQAQSEMQQIQFWQNIGWDGKYYVDDVMDQGSYYKKHSGTIQSVNKDDSSFSVKLDNGDTITVYWNNSTKLYQGKASDLNKGSEIRLLYQESYKGGVFDAGLATTIHVIKKSGSP